jgi:lycopene cyclase domain-containing protein
MLEHMAYLSLLLVSIAGLATLDHRFKLAFFFNRIRTIRTLAASIVLFVIWDILGISLGIFFIGSEKYLTGITILPNLPLEELFFLFVLTYSALLLFRGSEKLCSRT